MRLKCSYAISSSCLSCLKRRMEAPTASLQMRICEEKTCSYSTARYSTER